MKTCSAALEPSSGSPDQMTTSARRPGARLPISPPMPIASAGREVIIANASPQLTPVAPGTCCSATRLPAYWRSQNRLRVSLSSIMPIETLTPAARIRPTFDWVAAICSKRRGQVVQRRGDHRNAGARDPVGDQSSLRVAPTSTIFSAGTRASDRARGGCRSRARRGRADTAAPAAPAPAPPRRSGSGARPRCAARPARRRANSLGLRTTGRSRSSGCAAAADRDRRRIAAQLRRFAQRVAEQDVRRRARAAGLVLRRSRQARRTGTRAARVTGSMSAPVSITAPCPAKMLLPAVGATTARVTPSARLTAIGVSSGLIAGATSIAALNGPSSSALSVSFGAVSAPTGRPRQGRGARSRRRCPASPICRSRRSPACPRAASCARRRRRRCGRRG